MTGKFPAGLWDANLKLIDKPNAFAIQEVANLESVEFGMHHMHVRDR